MAEKKPAAGTAAPKQRAPRKLAAPIMDNEDNADSLRQALSESQSRQASLPEGWKPLGQSKAETAPEEIQSKPANIKFTPSDLARKYSLEIRGEVRSPNTIKTSEIDAAKERAQSYMKVASKQPLPSYGQPTGMTSTPQTEWAATKSNYEAKKVYDEEFRKNNPLPPTPSKPDTPPSKPFNIAAQQLDWREVGRPRLGRDRALPHRNALDIKPDGTVTVTPVKSAPGAPELAYTDKTRSFAPNETNITADEYRPAEGGHMVDGQHISAFTKHTIHYRKTNNNGVAGLLKIGENQHSGTFYSHPETGEVVQTNATPVEVERSAIELHHAELYRKHGQAHAAQIGQRYGKPVFKNADGTPLNAIENAKAVRHSIAGTTTSLNWARESLAKAIQSSRNGDVQGTMAELKQNPDAIHDLFNDHFVVGPEKEKAYKKAVKAGILQHIDSPDTLLKRKAKLLNETYKPYSV